MNRAATIAKLRRLAADPGASDAEREVAARKAETLAAGMREPPLPPRPPSAAANPAPWPSYSTSSNASMTSSTAYVRFTVTFGST
jgi:hypothetical protein